MPRVPIFQQCSLEPPQVFFPILLPSTNSRGESIKIADALAGPHTLRVGLAWWIFGMMLALLYFGIVYWLFRGKVAQHADTYGH